MESLGEQSRLQAIFNQEWEFSNFKLTDGSPQLFFSFRLSTSQVVLRKRCLYTSVEQSHKLKFWLDLSILGQNSTTGKAIPNQILNLGWGTSKFFNLWATNIHVTPQNSGLSTNGTINSEIVSTFSFYLRITKAQLFANILKEGINPSNCAPVFVCKCLQSVIKTTQKINRQY